MLPRRKHKDFLSDREASAFRSAKPIRRITPVLQVTTTRATTAPGLRVATADTTATATEAQSAATMAITITIGPKFIDMGTTTTWFQDISITAAGRTTAMVGTTRDSERSDQRDKEA